MGYFRLFYYIAYIFNTICRIIKRHGKQILWIVCIFGFLIFCLWPSRSHAVYYGDDTYTDPNLVIYKAYDSICIDFIRRIDQFRPTTSEYHSNYEFVKNRIVNLQNDYYFYYTVVPTNDRGLSMINGSIETPNYLYLLLYTKDNANFSLNSSTYDDYLGLHTQIYEFTYNNQNSNTNLLYRYTRSNSVSNLQINYDNAFYIPTCLLHYQNQYIYEYFFNDLTLQEIEQLYAINNSLDTITNDDITAETENTVESAIEDIPETFDNDYTQDIKDNEDTLLDTILTPIYTYADGTTTRRINFTLPFVNYTYQLRSDAISSHIRNTNIYTYVQLFWWFAFSIPIFMLLHRIVVWLGTGEFLNKPSRFAVYMSDFISKNITPGMM